MARLFPPEPTDAVKRDCEWVMGIYDSLPRTMRDVWKRTNGDD